MMVISPAFFNLCNRLRYVLVIALSALLSACMTPPSSHTPVVVVADETNLMVQDSLLYLQRVMAMPADEQKREIASTQQALQRERSTPQRLRLALLLALPSISGSDEQRALGTLEPLLSSALPSVKHLAQLLNEQLQERLRLERKQRTLQEQIDATDKRARNLQEQLDEIKAIERSLLERRPPSAPGRDRPAAATPADHGKK